MAIRIRYALSTNGCFIDLKFTFPDSDLVRFNILGSEYVVVNSMKVAIDLFDRRSMIYNDRYSNLTSI